MAAVPDLAHERVVVAPDPQDPAPAPVPGAVGGELVDGEDEVLDAPFAQTGALRPRGATTCRTSCSASISKEWTSAGAGGGGSGASNGASNPERRKSWLACAPCSWDTSGWLQRASWTTAGSSASSS